MSDIELNSPVFNVIDKKLSSPSKKYRKPFKPSKSHQELAGLLLVENWLQMNCCVEDDTIISERFQEVGLLKHQIDQSRASYFIQDWKKLWNHLASDPRDLFYENFTAYGDIVSFFCHGRTYRICWYLIIYHTLIALLCIIVSPQNNYIDTILFALVVDPAYFAVFYVWGYLVMKGPLAKREFVAPNVLVPTKNVVTRQRGSILGSRVISSLDSTLASTPRRSDSWSASVLRAISTMCKEVVFVFSAMSRDENAESELLRDDPSSGDIVQDIGLYQLLNVATKFVLLRGRGSRGASKTYYWLRVLVVVLTFCFLILAGFRFAILVKYEILSKCFFNPDVDRDTYNISLCAITTIYYATTLFGLTTSVSSFLMSMGGYVMLIGAGFVTIMAQQLSRSWVTRFDSLRLLQIPEDISEGEESISKTNGSCSEFSIDVAELEAGPDEDDDDKDISLSHDLQAFAKVVERDAFESYMFHCAIMQHVGNQINTLFIVSFTFSAGTFATQMFLALTSDEPSTAFTTTEAFVSCSLVFLVAVLCFFPLWCLADTNSTVKVLIDMVVGAGVNDFSVIGGRDVWTDFFRANPCYWRIFGFPLTYSAVGAMAVSLAVPIIYFFVPPDVVMGLFSKTTADEDA